MWKKLVETIANIGILFFCVQTEFMIFYKLKGVGDFLEYYGNMNQHLVYMELSQKYMMNVIMEKQFYGYHFL